MCVGSAPAPSPPPPLPPPPLLSPPPVPGEDTIVTGDQKRKRALAGAAGRDSILTGAGGVAGEANLGTRSLLGG